MFEGQERIRKSYLKLTANVGKDSFVAQCSSNGEKLGHLQNLVFTLQSNCIHGQEEQPSVFAQRGSKCALLVG